MSHSITAGMKFTNRTAVYKACHALNLPQPVEGSYKLFDRTVDGLGVRLPGWKYPVVVSSVGEALFDNYEGRWGSDAVWYGFQGEYVKQTMMEVMPGLDESAYSTVQEGSVVRIKLTV